MEAQYTQIVKNQLTINIYTAKSRNIYKKLYFVTVFLGFCVTGKGFTIRSLKNISFNHFGNKFTKTESFVLQGTINCE